MHKKDIFKDNQYRYGKVDGPVVTVYSIHPHIDNHYYIKYENGSVDTSQRERLYPLDPPPFTNHAATLKRYPKDNNDN
jgi:hypothetical protein